MILKVVSYIFAACILIGALSQVESSHWEPPVKEPAAVEKVVQQQPASSGCLDEAERVHQEYLRKAGY